MQTLQNFCREATADVGIKLQFQKIFLKKCNIKDYYLSYHCDITFNIYKIQCCSKKNLYKIFENLPKRKLFIDTHQRFCQHFKSFQYCHFKFASVSLRSLGNSNLAYHALFNQLQFCLPILYTIMLFLAD